MKALTHSPIDEELAALRAGETAVACAKIVELHGPLVKSACRRILRDEGLAEDAAQETFLLLIRKAPKLPPDTVLAGWLYHAACRTALNHQRAAMRRRVRENSVEAMNQMTPDTESQLWTDIEPHLDEAMHTLPERQRDLVVQCYFQNQSQRATAAALGCSESVVSRELRAALEGLRQFFAKRQVAVSGVALAGLLSTQGASATMTNGAAMVTAMMTTTTATAASTATTMIAGLMQSKLLLVALATAGTAGLATLGYQVATLEVAGGNVPSQASTPSVVAEVRSQPTKKVVQSKGGGAPKGQWVSNFRFTSEMALNESKKQVLLENDPDKRYGLLQKMGVGLSRAGFDQLILTGMDASVAPWRDTFIVLASRTDAFDNYVMAWSNEDPQAALNWVSAQPDGGFGMRKQLLYVIEAKQFEPEALRAWISGLKMKSMQAEATIAVESMIDPATLVTRMGSSGNEGFLVDLAMVHGDRLDWAAFGQKLGTSKVGIVQRAMRQVLEGQIPQERLNLMIQGLAASPEPLVSVGAVTILKAARGEAGVDYLQALKFSADGDRVGMGDFRSHIYQGWGMADPEGAMQYTSRLKNLAWMRDVIRGLTTLPDESTLLSWTAGAPHQAKDIALAAVYGRSSKGLAEHLEKIMSSNAIMDQVAAAQEVMRMIPLPEAPAAAQWLKQLPEEKARQELAMALVRRLAEVDPQATLELVESEKLNGADFDRLVSNVVTQFSARNDIETSTRFIQQIGDPKRYADALGQLAMVKFAGRPQEAFVYIQANSRGNWQAAALRMLTDNYYNKLGNIDANAAEILKLDLPKLAPHVANRANHFCKIWLDQRVPLEVPLAWTQQLPGPMGKNTREFLAKNKELRPETVEQFYAWTQKATITPEERAQLQVLLGKRLEEQAGR